MRITFKNVGQGDSILLEWRGEDNSNQYGIIDCKKFKSINPLIDEIKSKEIDNLAFLILSHPHYDHFSGMRELLDYCSSESIYIEKFLFTCYQAPKYLRSAVKSPRARTELARLLIRVRELKREDAIGHFTYLNTDVRDLQLNKELKLKTLAPSTDELEYYIDRRYSDTEENQDSQPFGNWLSTVLKISNGDWIILLTSDVEREVIKKIGHEKKDELSSYLILGQVPHHGSIKNHSNEFWRTLNRKNPRAIISVGKNNYDHPHEKVVRKFQDYNFKLYATNQVGALKNPDLKHEYLSERLLENIGIEDSPRELQNIKNGDIVFEVHDGEAVRV